MRKLLLAGALPALTFAVPAAAQDDYVQVGIGADYSTGDYGEEISTDFLAVPVSFKLQRGDFNVRVSIPYLDVTGPSEVIPGDGGVRGGSPDDPVVSRSGLGDVVAAATYSLALDQATFFDVTGKVKLPTASQSDFLGTGTTDFTLQGEVLRVFGSTSAALRAGRRFNGSSDLYPLQDVWLAGAGVYHALGSTTLGLDYDWRQGSLPTAPDRSELTGSVTQKLSDALRLQGYVYTGFSEGSPDIGAGAQVLVRMAN